MMGLQWSKVLNMCGSLLQRNLKVAQALGRDSETKRAEAVRLALEFETAKNAAREAGQVTPLCILLISRLRLWCWLDNPFTLKADFEG